MYIYMYIYMYLHLCKKYRAINRHVHVCISTTQHVQVDENMKEAQKKDSLHQGTFYFQRNLFPHLEPHRGPSAHYRECELMDSNTIFNGTVRERELGNVFSSINSSLS